MLEAWETVRAATQPKEEPSPRQRPAYEVIVKFSADATRDREACMLTERAKR